MFAAGHNFFVEVDPREYQLRFHHHHHQSGDDDSPPPTIVQHGRGQEVIAISASDHFVAVITSFPLHSVGIAQDASVYEYSHDDHQVRRIWSANLPPELYKNKNNSSNNNNNSSSSSSSSPVALCVERGGNGGIAIGWPTTDVVAIFEPPTPQNNNDNNNNCPTFVVCRKRFEHPPSLLSLGSELLFSISGQENRLQSWSRNSGEGFREGGILSTKQKATSMTYESSEGVLIIGFDNGSVRLISVEKHSMMVAIATIDIAKVISTFGTRGGQVENNNNSNSLSILKTSFAQPSTGECLIISCQGIVSFNLRNQDAKLKMEFMDDRNQQQYESASILSSSSGFCLMGPYSDGTDFELIELTNSFSIHNDAKSASSPYRGNQQQQSPSSVGHWSNRIQVGDNPGQAKLAVHDDVSSIHSSSTIVSSFAVAQQQQHSSEPDVTSNDFNFAQHSNISYNDDLDEENDEEEEEGEEEYYNNENGNDDDDDDRGTVISDIQPDDLDIVSTLGDDDQQQAHQTLTKAAAPTTTTATTATWKKMAPAPKTASSSKTAAKIPTSLPSAKKSSMVPKPGLTSASSLRPPAKKSSASSSNTFTVSNTTATSKAMTTTKSPPTSAATKQEESEDTASPRLSSDCLFVLPNFNDDLPPSLKTPLELPQEKQDPKAKPVTFRRGGPVKSSGYSASSNVPWSVQQAEKQKKKKLAAAKAKQQQQLQANNFVSSPTAFANYNTAVGAVSAENEKINSQVLDKTPLHSATISTSCFDLLGNLLFTGSTDGTCHVLKFGANSLSQGKYEGQAFSGFVAVDGERKSDNSAISVSTASGVSGPPSSSTMSSSTTTSANSGNNIDSSSLIAPQQKLPITSIDVGIGSFDPSSINSRNVALSSPQSVKNVSWNVFATAATGGSVTIWAPNPLQSGGVSPKIRHVFSKDARSVRFAMRDSLLLVANGGTISTCKYVLDLQKDELHRGRNLSRFSVVSEFGSNAQSVLSIDTFNTLNSSLVAYGTSSKQVGVLDLRRPDAAAWSIDEAHSRPVHAVALQRCSAFSDVASPLEETFSIFASASIDNCVKLWDLRSKSSARVLNKHTNTALQLGLCLSPCSRFVACGSEDRSVVIYDIAMGRILSKMKCPDQVTTLRYHPLKPMMFAGLANGKSKVFTC